MAKYVPLSASLRILLSLIPVREVITRHLYRLLFQYFVWKNKVRNIGSNSGYWWL
jgi:hypothetical protein